jgi:hypothetical protein
MLDTLYEAVLTIVFNTDVILVLFSFFVFTPVDKAL